MDVKRITGTSSIGRSLRNSQKSHKRKPKVISLSPWLHWKQITSLPTYCGLCYILSLLQPSVQFSHSVVSNSLQPHASLSITNSWSLPKLMSIESVMPSNHLILCRPLLLLSSSFPNIRVFSNESALHIRWPKYWSFSFKISPSNEHPGLISFRMHWLDLLAVQGTLKSLLISITVQKHQFSGAQFSSWSNSDVYTWLLEKPLLWLDVPLSAE